MTSQTTDHNDSADGPSLQAILDAVMVRSEAIDRLMEIIESNTAELRRTQEVLDNRPTKEDVAYHRRKTLVSLILFGVFVIFVHDQHLERCGPGVEAKAVIATYLNTQAEDREQIRDRLAEASKQATPEYCTVVFPLHVHDDEADWPNYRAIFGMSLYAGLFTGLFFWLRASYRRMVASSAVEKATQPRNRRQADRGTHHTD